MSKQNGNKPEGKLSASEAAKFVSSGEIVDGKFAVELPEEVIQCRKDYLYRSLEDLDVIKELSYMLWHGQQEQGLSEATDRYAGNIAYAINALTERVRGECIGGLAEEYFSVAK